MKKAEAETKSMRVEIISRIKVVRVSRPHAWIQKVFSEGVHFWQLFLADEGRTEDDPYNT